VAQPAGIPEKFEDHVRLLYDLQLLAYQSDLTRVTTFMYGREQTGRPYPADRRARAAPSAHTPSGQPGEDGQMRQNSAVSYRAVCRVSGKATQTPDGDGSLLDHVILLFGSGISNSDRHTHGPLPTFLVGGGSGTLKGGRHLVYPEHTPLTNLQLTLLNKLGVPPKSWAIAMDNSGSCLNCLHGLAHQSLAQRTERRTPKTRPPFRLFPGSSSRLYRAEPAPYAAAK
jgi:hypothetical protein